MPELAQPLPYGIRPPVFNPEPLPIYHPPPLAPTTLTTIAQGLSQLPDILIKSYEAGRQLKQQKNSDKYLSQALANPDKYQISVGPGGITARPYNPYEIASQQSEAQLRSAEARKAQAEAGQYEATSKLLQGTGVDYDLDKGQAPALPPQPAPTQAVPAQPTPQTTTPSSYDDSGYVTPPDALRNQINSSGLLGNIPAVMPESDTLAGLNTAATPASTPAPTTLSLGIGGLTQTTPGVTTQPGALTGFPSVADSEAADIANAPRALAVNQPAQTEAATQSRPTSLIDLLHPKYPDATYRFQGNVYRKMGDRIEVLDPFKRDFRDVTPKVKSQTFESVKDLMDNAQQQGFVVGKISQSPDGRYYASEAAPVPKLSRDTQQLVSRAGYTPQPGENEEQIRAKSNELLDEQNKVPQYAIGDYKSFKSSLNKDPVVLNFIKAREQYDKTNALLANPSTSGLTPAAALGELDNYVRSVRGGAASKGMVNMMNDARTMTDNLKLKWQQLTGGSNQQGLITPDMAKDMQAIMGRVKDAAEQEVKNKMEGDVEDLRAVGIKRPIVENVYKRILNEGSLPTEGGNQAQPAQVDSLAKDPRVLSILNSNMSRDQKKAAIKALPNLQ